MPKPQVSSNTEPRPKARKHKKKPQGRGSCCGCLTLLVVLLVIMGLIGSCLGLNPTTDSATGTSDTTSSASTSPTQDTAEPTRSTPSPTSAPSSVAPSSSHSPSGPASPTLSPSPTPSPTATADAGSTARVTRVVDGDTLVISTGERVRLLGIDTPERGECHFGTASDHMEELVLNRDVTLTADGRDTDRYGRLLRYVDVGGVDTGLSLIREGLAVSRYDSRDGYGFHSREPDYIAADRAATTRTCDPPPQVYQDNDSCDPNYIPCVPPFPPDLNCSDIGVMVEVIGRDVHGFDRDGDGWGCESYR